MDVLTSAIYVAFALLVLGVLLAFSPTILITELAILTKSKNPAWLSLFLIAGVATPIVVFSLLAFWFIDPNARIYVPETRHILQIFPLLDFIIGTLFIVAGIRIRKSNNPPANVAKPKVPLTIFTPKKIFLFGLVRTITRLSGLAAILLAGQLLKKNSDGPYAVLGIAWLAAVALSPMVVLLFMQHTHSKSFAKIANYSEQVASIHWRNIISTGLIICGCLFILYGVFG
jgi:hypothetical protein